MTILETRTQDWPDEAACAATAAGLASHIAARPALRQAFITLHGTLGAGKTTFARYLLQALGVTGRIKSPTYAVLEEYTLNDAGVNANDDRAKAGGALTIRHFDFYRFNDPQEWEDAGFRELFAADGLTLAEWPEQVGRLLPQADLSLHLAPGQGDQRSARFDAHTPLGLELLP